MYKRTFVDYLILFIKGLAMGTANKIPGVSGGMIALVTGFYEELIYSYQKINLKALKLIIDGRFQKFWEYINFKFLFWVTIGSISAFFSVSLVIDYLIKPISQGGLGLVIEVYGYFFGMIIGSVIYVSRKIRRWNVKAWLGVLLGSALGLWISFLDPMTPNDHFLFIFFCGILSVSGMTLPGFSGSFLLIILGNYNLLLVDAVNNLFFTITALFQGDFYMLGTATLAERSERIHMLWVVTAFALGSFAGLVSLSKLIGYLLKNFHNVVLSWLMGFIIGSLGAAWPWKDEVINPKGKLIGYARYLPELDTASFWVQALCILLGIFTILIIEYYEKRATKKP